MGNPERITTRYFGAAEPSSIDAYVKTGGYGGLRRALESLGAGRALDEVARSRLKGRGGAGFDVATKWRSVCEAEGQPKFVVCNAYDADERAPISRTLLEQSPHIVLEGMIIAAFAVGASRGFIYCRGRASTAISMAMQAIEQARARAFVGVGVLGTEFDFEVSLATHLGGLIGGEETAMFAAMRGQRAMPGQRPPYPSQSGFRGRPTLVHNAETFAAIPWIINNGGEAFARLGTPQSTGTKIFTLDGDTRNRTLIELPFGTTIREAIAGTGHGLANAEAIKAIHLGGPLGGCLPAALLDTPLAYESLAGLGMALGSGRLTALNQHTCLVGYTRQLMTNLSGEACGKCAPCRLGTKRIATMLDSIVSNLGQPEDIQLLQELAQNMKDASLCNFGVEAANIVLGSLNHFGDEFRVHVEEKRCPTGQCQPLRKQRYQRRAVL